MAVEEGYPAGMFGPLGIGPLAARQEFWPAPGWPERCDPLAHDAYYEQFERLGVS